MRQMEVCKKQSKLQGEEENTLVYYVTIDELADAAAGIVLETYGVGITIIESGETATVPNITFSKTDILTLVNQLAEYLVTPVTVNDVVSDWICL